MQTRHSWYGHRDVVGCFFGSVWGGVACPLRLNLAMSGREVHLSSFCRFWLDALFHAFPWSWFLFFHVRGHRYSRYTLHIVTWRMKYDVTIIKKRMRCRKRLPIFVFFHQRAPLAPLWPLRAPTWTTPSSISCPSLNSLCFPSFLEEEPSFSKLLFLWALF